MALLVAPFCCPVLLFGVSSLGILFAVRMLTVWPHCLRRYQVLEQVGAAAFSRAVQAYDTLERRLVCLKVVKVGVCVRNEYSLYRPARCAAIVSVPLLRHGCVALAARALS